MSCSINLELPVERNKGFLNADLCFLNSAPTVADSVREDMEILKNDPYLPKEMEIIGYEYDVFTGKTKEVGVMYRN